MPLPTRRLLCCRKSLLVAEAIAVAVATGGEAIAAETRGESGTVLTEAGRTMHLLLLCQIFAFLTFWEKGAEVTEQNLIYVLIGPNPDPELPHLDHDLKL